MKNKVLLVGGFHKATALANSLIHRGYLVTIINENYSDCMSLAENNKLKVIHGDGSKPYVLDDAEAYDNEIAIALTQHDEDNLVICQLCKKKFGIKKTVSLVNDPKKTDFFHNMGIDSVVCAINTITGIIEQQAFMDEMATVLPIGQGNLSIAEVPISQSAPSVDKKIWEIDLPKEVIIGCILRGENSMVPRGDTRLLAGDILVLISSKENQISAIRELTGR
ncbi:trk system potassium uptake protein TrkA [Lachnotalea glycerini]|uniref:Trk system potassium uptake protein TrkA n=1 Tax=Lachnotalea glycerini TaxID=1763509 RepID=A0A255IJJ0_9FIRM|nr:NAD-binding protein [Lachnotalea glycerini]OYP07085.1 potassium transporter TrkA [Lachnotalea glycerini]PXV95634.1 trk system potassium uptake protein TrkA [Lachnotalea glycerini]RDY32923.1 TrkA family potassium uptake protein [Lachnotalea glycerini]